MGAVISTNIMTKYNILLATFFLSIFVFVEFPIPFPMIYIFLLSTFKSKFIIGILLGWSSIIGAWVIAVKYRKNELKKAIGQLIAAFFLYLSWCFFAYVIYLDQVNKIEFWDFFVLHLVLSTPFQITTLIVFCKLIKESNLIQSNKVSTNKKKKFKCIYFGLLSIISIIIIILFIAKHMYVAGPQPLT